MSMAAAQGLKQFRTRTGLASDNLAAGERPEPCALIAARARRNGALPPDWSNLYEQQEGELQRRERR